MALHHTHPDTARVRKRIAWVTLGLWLLCTSAAIAALTFRGGPTAVADGQVAEAARRWYAYVPGTHAGEATIVRLATSDCRCDAASPGWSSLAARWRDAGANVIEGSDLPPLPAAMRGFDLLLFDGKGRPLYAGPIHPGAMCGTTHIIDTLLAASSRGGMPSLLTSARECPCS